MRWTGRAARGAALGIALLLPLPGPAFGEGTGVPLPWRGQGLSYSWTASAPPTDERHPALLRSRLGAPDFALDPHASAGAPPPPAPAVDIPDDPEAIRDAAARHGVRVVAFRLLGERADIDLIETVPGGEIRGPGAVAWSAARHLAPERRHLLLRVLGQDGRERSWTRHDLTALRRGAPPPEPPPTTAPANDPAGSVVPARFRPALADILTAELTAAGFAVSAIGFAGRHVTLHSDAGPHRNSPQAVGRIARLATPLLPAEVAEIRVVLEERGLPLIEVGVPRDSLARALTGGGSAEELWHSLHIGPPSPPVAPAVLPESAWPRTAWWLDLRYRQTAGRNADGDRIRLEAGLGGRLDLAPGLSLVGEIAQALPASTGLSRLHLESVGVLAPSLYGRLSAGLLESRFAGLGGELLYRPADAPWALGADLFVGRQRDRDLGRPVDLYGPTVVTGHVSGYLHAPTHDLLGILRLGRYLAGDVGATVELRRRFDTGLEIGAFMTFTDGPRGRYGGRVFDRGVILDLPLDLVWAGAGPSRLSLAFHSSAADGGARVMIAQPLYRLTQRASRRDFQRDWRSVLR